MNSGSSGIFRNCFMNSGVVFIVIVVLLCAEFVLENSGNFEQACNVADFTGKSERYLR